MKVIGTVPTEPENPVIWIDVEAVLVKRGRVHLVRSGKPDELINHNAIWVITA